MEGTGVRAAHAGVPIPPFAFIRFKKLGFTFKFSDKNIVEADIMVLL